MNAFKYEKNYSTFHQFLGWVQGQTLFDLSSFYVLLDIVIIGKVFYSKYICLITLR